MRRSTVLRLFAGFSLFSVGWGIGTIALGIYQWPDAEGWWCPYERITMGVACVLLGAYNTLKCNADLAGGA